MEASYRVVIIPGSGSEIDIETEDDCSGDTCSYTFSSDDITDSYSVAVEVVACTTERFTCNNISSCEYMYMCTSIYMYMYMYMYVYNTCTCTSIVQK